MKNSSKIFEDAPVTTKSEGLLNSIKEDLNAPFVPNFFTVWAEAPEALKGIFPVMKHILASGHLSRQLKEMIMLSISSKNDCKYCVAAHQAFAGMMGVSSADIQSLITTQTTADKNDRKTSLAVDYALKLSKDPNSGTLKDITELKEVGYSKPEILEIIAMSGMSVFYNHLADATQLYIDEAFTMS